MGTSAALNDGGEANTVKGTQERAREGGGAASSTAVGVEACASMFTASESAEFQQILTGRHSFMDVERHYQDVLMTLEGDEKLHDFRVEYEGLHGSLLSVHESEGRLIRKCTDLQSDINLCVKRVVSAAELTQDDSDTITKLRAETERLSQRLVDVAEKERQLKEMITTVKQEIAELQAKATAPIELPAQENALYDMKHLHETLLREEERLAQLQHNASRLLISTQSRYAALLQNNAENLSELAHVRKRISKTEEEVQAVKSLRALKEEELRAVRQTTLLRIAYSTSQQETLDVLLQENDRNGQQVRECQNEEARLNEEHQGICRQLRQVHTAMHECNDENELWKRRASEKAAALEEHQVTAAALHARILKAQKVVEAMHRRNAVMEARRADKLERQRELTARLSEEEAALARARQAVRTVTQMALSARKEVDVLQLNIVDKESEQRKNATWLVEKQAQLQMLGCAMASCEDKAEQICQELCRVAKEAEISESNKKKYAFACALLLREIEHKSTELGNYEEMLPQVETRIKHHHMQLEAMMTERENFTAHCNQLRHGLGEQQHSLTTKLAKVTAMRGGIQKREKDFRIEEARIQLLWKQQRELQKHVDGYRRQTEKRIQCAAVLGEEIYQLREVLRDASDETSRQRRRCRDIIHERDLLTRQATERSAEVYALCKQARSQKTRLQHLGDLYRERAMHLEHLEYQTTLFEGQLAQMRRFVIRLPELRVLLNNATRELQREKARVRAMLDEAGRSVNVHPYNELISAEPETYQLLQRVHELQRVLVQRGAQLHEKQAAIQSAEERYMKAKAFVAQQPGPEIAEQLTAYQQNLVKKNKHLAQMQETLEFFKSQAELFTSRHEVLRGRLAELGKTYGEKRAEQEKSVMAGSRVTTSDQLSPSTPSEPVVYHGFTAPPLSTSDTVSTPLPLPTPPPLGE